MIKFYRGLKSAYQAATTHQDGIYFATDTKELLMNGNAYGIPYTFDDSALDSRLDAVEGAIEILNGNSSAEGSVAYQIAQIVAGADASFDTLKEIADWILSDTTGAAKMASDIAALQTAVNAIDYSGKADKLSMTGANAATENNFMAIDANGNIKDSGVNASSFQAAGNYKTVQTAKSDPTASGNAVSFIDSISQDTNGVITATKKTVTSADGSNAGLMSSADYTKLAGIEADADVNVLEGVKINGSTVTIDANKIADLGSNYVQDASYVHTDNNYTSTEKTKLAGIAEGAQVNVIETIKVGNTAQTVTSKTVSLGTAAGADTTDFDAAGAAAAVLGANTDTWESNTVYGAKAYTDHLLEWNNA